MSRCDDNAINRGDVIQGAPRWTTVANNSKVKRLNRLLNADEITPIRFLEEVSWVMQGALNHGMKLDRDSDTESDSD